MKRRRWSVRSVSRTTLSIVHYPLFIIYLTLFITHYSLAQLNSWQSHVSYRSGKSVAVVGDKIYAATQNGFFYYDKSTNEIVTLGKQEGLSDVGISRLLYLTDQKRLLIAYQNGNLDLLSVTDTGEPGSVKNVSVIRTASNLPIVRTINHLNRVGRNVYISTNFGLVVLDIVSDEIRDTYFTDPEIITYATAVANDSLYALTSPPNSTSDYGLRYRLRAIRLTPTVNIADPANWRPVQGPDVFMRSLLADRGRLYVSVDNKGVYERQNGGWVLTQSVANKVIRLFPSPNGLLSATEQVITLPNSTSFTGPLLTNPAEVAADGERVWVADAQNGLLAGKAGAFERIAPEGPVRDQFTNLYAYPQTLVALPSPTDSPQAELYSVPDGRWQSITTNNRSVSFRAAVYLPAEQRLYLGGSGGLWSQTNEQPLQPVALPGPIGPNVSITSLATDSDGNLWIGTGGSNGEPASLYVRRSDGAYETLPGTRAAIRGSLRKIVPDDNGFLWLMDAEGELVLFDLKTGRSRLLYLRANAVVKDRTGIIWIGTDQGPLVSDNSSAVFEQGITPLPPLLNGRRLLANQIVTSIAVDGGNGKWIGTHTGLYHIAPNGSQLLDSFTADNSPLPDNAVQALAIEPVSGRVFIQTGHGIISYRASATEPAETLSLSNVTIFPNPVRPDFSGTVGINGLTDNATVKVLDAGGQLVYETRSQGGTATWNLRDYRNRPAQTGVYLIVVVAADGVEGLAGKLAVVR